MIFVTCDFYNINYLVQQYIQFESVWLVEFLDALGRKSGLKSHGNYMGCDEVN